MKRKMVMFLAMVMCVSMCACGGEEKEDSNVSVEVVESSSQAIIEPSTEPIIEASSEVAQEPQVEQPKNDSLEDKILGRWYQEGEYKRYYWEFYEDGKCLCVATYYDTYEYEYKVEGVDEKKGILTVTAPDTGVSESTEIIIENGKIACKNEKDGEWNWLNEEEWDAIRGGANHTMILGKWMAVEGEGELVFVEHEKWNATGTCTYSVNGEEKVFTIGFNYTELCKDGSVVQLRDVETNTLVQCLEISMDNGVITLTNSEYYHDLFGDQEIKFVHESDYAAMK